MNSELEKLDNWLTIHFEEIINKYGGYTIGVIDETVIVVMNTMKQVHLYCKCNYPNKIPFIMNVPTDEDLDIHLLPITLVTDYDRN